MFKSQQTSIPDREVSRDEQSSMNENDSQIAGGEEADIRKAKKTNS